jgi:Ca2+-binding RTX toxin-like protein
MASINGTSGNDSLLGTANNDVINGLGGIDTIAAGDGDDRIILWKQPALGNQPYSIIDGGSGHDILDLSGWDGPHLDIANNTTTQLTIGVDASAANGQVYTAVADVRNVEEIWLPEAGGTFLGGSGGTTGWKIIGGSGPDAVSDGRGSDTISTGAGDDGVTFHGGNDQVSLGDGNDTYRAEGLTFFSGNPTIDAGAGTDELQWDTHDITLGAKIDLEAGQATDGISHLTISNFENVRVQYPLPYSAPGWELDISGTEGPNEIHISIVGSGAGWTNGRAGNDSIYVSGGSTTTDTVYGGSGDDFVVGDDGANWINGGQAPNDRYDPVGTSGGNDTLFGGIGNDHIYGNSQFAVAGAPDGNDSIYASSGSDYVNGNAGDDTIIGDSGSDRLYGGAGNDLIFGDAATTDPSGIFHGNDHLNGNKGNDTLYGGGGNDDLRGGQDNDELHGGDGSDTLGGDAGDDLLDGGPGQDLLTGGAGQDIFKFDLADAQPGQLASGQVDTITDFTHGADQIWLPFHPVALRDAGSVVDAISAKAAADALVGTSAGQTVVEAEVGHDLYLIFAGAGSGAIDSMIRLENINPSNLTIADFV